MFSPPLLVLTPLWERRSDWLTYFYLRDQNCDDSKYIHGDRYGLLKFDVLLSTCAGFFYSSSPTVLFLWLLLSLKSLLSFSNALVFSRPIGVSGNYSIYNVIFCFILYDTNIWVGFEKLLDVLSLWAVNARGQELGWWFVLESTLMRCLLILTCDKFQDHRMSKHRLNSSWAFGVSLSS